MLRGTAALLRWQRPVFSKNDPLNAEITYISVCLISTALADPSDKVFQLRFIDHWAFKGP